MNLTAEQLLELVVAMEGKAAAARTDKRTSNRIGLRYRINIKPLAGAQINRIHSSWLRDVSSGGIGIAIATPLAEGEMFVAMLPRAGGNRLDMVCSARHCRAAGPSLWHIGAKFVSEWNAEERQAVRERTRRQRRAG